MKYPVVYCNNNIHIKCTLRHPQTHKYSQNVAVRMSARYNHLQDTGI